MFMFKRIKKKKNIINRLIYNLLKVYFDFFKYFIQMMNKIEFQFYQYYFSLKIFQLTQEIED